MGRALDSHEFTVKQAIELRHYTAGTTNLSRAYLEKTRDKGQLIDVSLIGLASFAPDVRPELVSKTIGSFKSYGVVRASQELKDIMLFLEPA